MPDLNIILINNLLFKVEMILYLRYDVYSLYNIIQKSDMNVNRNPI